MEQKVFLSREELAERWGASLRTIDRRRNLGLIPWLDLNAGKLGRPAVRFRLEDILEYETGNTIHADGGGANQSERN